MVYYLLVDILEVGLWCARACVDALEDFTLFWRLDLVALGLVDIMESLLLGG